MITALVAKIVWLVGVVSWFVIRIPHQRRNRKKNVVVDDRKDIREQALLAGSLAGLGVVPMTYAFTGFPRFADYPFQPAMAVLGCATFAFALYLFYRTHKELGRNWSVTLEMRERHDLVTDGLYRYVRHPMYSAFWLMAVSQFLLLPNWIAGLSGFLGFGTLFFGRVFREEAMMVETFGDAYRDYMKRTARVLPGIY